MCGRYYISDDLEESIRRLLQEDFREDGLSALSAGSAAVRDICPSEKAAIITGSASGSSSLACREMTWGYPNPAGKGLLINARAETVRQKRMFRDGIAYRRCVIPASGFYEWDHDKNKASFSHEDRSPVWLAGFYDLFDDLLRFIILTTAANASVKPVHDRMPCILRADQIYDWLRRDDKTDSFMSMEMPTLRRYQEYEQQSLFL